MEFKTLTSTLVLSFLLAGSNAMAMDEEKPGDSSSTLTVILSPVVSEVTEQQELDARVAATGVTQADFLSASVRHPDLLEALAVARTEKNLQELKRITDLLLKEAIENPSTETPKKESWSLYNWLFGKSEEKASDLKVSGLPTPIPPVTTQVENIAEDGAPPSPVTIAQETEKPAEGVTPTPTPTPADSVKIEPVSKETENSSSSFFSKLNLNPLKWNLWGTSTPNAPATKNTEEGSVPLTVEGQKITINPNSVIEGPKEEKTDNLLKPEVEEQK